MLGCNYGSAADYEVFVVEDYSLAFCDGALWFVKYYLYFAVFDRVDGCRGFGMSVTNLGLDV